MLKSLFIKNFVLIDNLKIDFDEGFSAFIGETGAGKSILMDAISLVCGSRATSDVIGKGATSTLIEAEFEITQKHTTNALLIDLGLDSEDDLLVLTRTITSDGKSVARINRRVVNISVLKEVGDSLIDIHSQFDSANIRDKKNYLSLLDRFEENKTLLQAYHEVYHEYKNANDTFEAFKKANLNTDDLELLHFNHDEIEKLKVLPDEVETLEKRSNMIMHSQKIQEKGKQVVDLLKGDDGALDKIYEASKLLKGLSDIETFKELSENFENTYYNLDDMLQKVTDLLSDSEESEAELNTIENRLFKINKLLRKHNCNAEGLDNILKNIELKINQIENREEYIKSMDFKIAKLHKEAMKLASDLSDYRKKIARNLELDIKNQLKDLALPNATFEIAFSESKLSSKGIDDLNFMISMNKGEVLRPLEKSASGGELSRFMLGLKVIFAKAEGIPTLIFDEIDSGISGATAFSIGHKMLSMSKNVQVFAVTHLAQVAAASDHLFFLSKDVIDDHTNSSVEEVIGDELINKLALIGFGDINPKSIDASKELLKKAKHG